jgi:hypothetical protein
MSSMKQRRWGYIKVGKAFRRKGLLGTGECEIRSTAFPPCSSSLPGLLDALARTSWPLRPFFVVLRCSHFFPCFQPLNCQFNCHFWATESAWMLLPAHPSRIIRCQTLVAASILPPDGTRRSPVKATNKACVPRFRLITTAGTC